jgi:O-antigen/teichoic acid export membrane protein
MQKNRDIKKIITIITITFIALFVSIMGLRTPVITLGAICIFFIIPDFITTIVATLYNKYEWKLILRNFNHSYYKTHKSLKVLAPLGFVSALVIIYSRLDILIALPILGSELQSKYSFGFRFTEPFSMLLGILTISFIAEMANIKNINVFEYYSRIYKKIFSIKFLCVGFIINLFLAISLALFANYYFKFNEILLVFILSMSMGIKFINSFLSSFFIRKTLYVDLLKITSVVSIVIIVCSWQLSISHGIIGIAIATLIGETLNLILQKDYLNKFFKKNESI